MEEKKKRNYLSGLIIIGILLIILMICVGVLVKKNRTLYQRPNPEITDGRDDVEEKMESSKEISVVASIDDKIKNDTVWCGTFQLIWNDLKNELAKQDIKFQEQPEVVNNLNKETFSTNDVSEDSYYKKIGHPTQETKDEIEKGIKDKFNETSNLLNDFDFNGSTDDYFLYCMLKKEFQFENKFTKLDNDYFGKDDKYKDVQYFGIDNSSKSNLKDQVEILYYNSNDDYAVKLFTKQNDEIILAKGENSNKGNSFYDIYENINNESSSYTGNRKMESEDQLKVPFLKMNKKEEFSELENKPFLFSNGFEYSILKAMQTIEFDLDETGGKIKSEAAMDVAKMSIMDESQPKMLYFDDTFTIFIKESERQLPYFAARIDNISLYQ